MDKLTAILRAAGELIAKQGFEETSVQEIADLAGVAAGTVIYHFKTKHNLLFILTRQIQYRILNHARAAVSGALPPKDGLHALIDAYFEYAGENLADMLVIQKADPYFIMDMSKFPNMDYTIIIKQYFDMYCDAVRRGIADGSFATVVVEKYCSIIIALLYGLCRMSCYGHNVASYREEVLKLVDKGLSVR
jgi:AcrR family transcriptional regulator